jgi:hypothetical protein
MCASGSKVESLVVIVCCHHLQGGLVPGVSLDDKSGQVRKSKKFRTRLVVVIMTYCPIRRRRNALLVFMSAICATYMIRSCWLLACCYVL